MNKSIIFFLFSIGFNFTFSQWTPVSTIGNNDLKSIKFFNASTGIAAGKNGIWRSTNGGINWQTSLSGQNINSMSFPDNNIGFAVGDSGKIYYTSNNGLDWLQQVNSTTLHLYSVSFLNTNYGYIVGQNGIILRTTNSGSFWFSNTNPLTQDLNCVLMLNNNSSAFAVGSNSTEIFTSTANGGTNWVYSLMIPNNSLHSLSNIPTLTGNFIAVGGNGRIRRTTNNGGSWTLITSVSNQNLNEILFINSNLGYIVGNNGVILKTTNSGLNWVIDNSMTTVNLESISFINSNTGWIAGSSGIILRMGIPVSIQSTNTLNESFFSQNYPNPFNPKTSIMVELSKNETIELSIYDIEGNLIIKKFLGTVLAGQHLITIDLSEYSTGVYFYEIVTGTNIQRKKMILIK